jgi:Tfp pilus assembly major pilin PilA
MATQKYTGKNQLVNRLSAQVGNKPEAIAILKSRGDLKPDGKTFTTKGAKRNSMTAKERAIDRAAKESGKSKTAFKYDVKTNSATLKRK